MKLSVPTTFQRERAGRPPLHTRVMAVAPDDPTTEWPLYLRLRLAGYDLATTAATAGPPGAVETDLLVRQAGQVWRFPVRLEPLAGPLTAWHVLYRGAPATEDLRREWRNAVDTFSGWVRRLDADADERMPTSSYDFSLSAIRFFLPWRLAVGDRVAVRWQCDGEPIDGTMTLVRRDDAVVWWRRQPGYQAVGRWETLADTMARRWRTYCWRHQPRPATPS